MKEALLQAVRNGMLGNFISNEGHNLSKEELKRIIIELDYQLYEATRGTQREIKHTLNLFEELNERL